jgi:RNA polymerase sigma factor (sigma-70 family)
MGTSTDNELVEASRRGELGAFGELVARYQDVVCAVSYSSTGDRALSEDVAQETFVAAWRKLDRVRAGALRPWLCAIARNLGRKARRRTRHEQPIEEAAYVAAGASPFDELARADSERIVRDALSRVPEKYREVLVLYYRDNQSIRGVAETLGISEDAVTQRLSRGRKYLADGLTALVEKSLRGTRPRRDLVAAVLATVAAIVIPSRVDAHPLKAKGSTMLKVAIVASALAAAGTTVYLVRSHGSAQATTAPAHAATTPLHYGTGAARRPALGPTAPIHPNAARAASVDDLALLPTDSQLMLGVDMSRVQHSPLWQMAIAPALANVRGLRDFETECGIDIFGSLASVTIGMKGMGDRDTLSGAIVVHGFAKAKTFACLAKHHEKHDTGAELRTDGDVLLALHDGQPHAALKFLDDSTALLMLGPDATKDGIVRLAGHHGSAPSYSEMLGEINTDDAVWLAVADGSPMLAEANRKLAAHTQIRLHGLYGSIDLSDGLVINAGARTGSPELVAKLVSDLQAKLDQVAASGELKDRFQQLDINGDGGDIILSLAMSTTQLMSLAGNASGHISAHVAQHAQVSP